MPNISEALEKALNIAVTIQYSDMRFPLSYRRDLWKDKKDENKTYPYSHLLISKFIIWS